MAITFARFNFTHDSPSLKHIIKHAQALGQLPIQVESSGDKECSVAFECHPGVVKLTAIGNTVNLRANTGASPVLLSLIEHAIRDLDGERGHNIEGPANELQLPLTADYVLTETAHFQRKINRAVRKLYGLFWTLILAAAIAFGGVIWLLVILIRYINEVV